MDDEKKYIVLVIYDIVDNKRRLKVSKHLASYGTRVQKSAFEARLTGRQYRKMLDGMERILDDTDNIRVYRMTGYEEITVYGNKNYPHEDEVIII